MAFKRKYQTKAEIPPEGLRHYFARDGAWFLDADTSEERAQRDEYRSQSIHATAEPTMIQQGPAQYVAGTSINITSLADRLPKRGGLAAVSSIWLVSCFHPPCSALR